MVEVQGYGQTKVASNRKEGSNQARSDMDRVSQVTPRMVEGSDGPSACKVTLIKTEKSGTQSLTLFLAILQEINEAIHGDMGFQISN